MIVEPAPHSATPKRIQVLSRNSSASINWPPTRHSSGRRPSMMSAAGGAVSDTAPLTPQSGRLATVSHPPPLLPDQFDTCRLSEGSVSRTSSVTPARTQRGGHLLSAPTGIAGSITSAISPRRSYEFRSGRVTNSQFRRSTAALAASSVDDEELATARQEERRRRNLATDEQIAVMSRTELEGLVSALREKNLIMKSDGLVLRPKVEELRDGLKASYSVVEREGENISNQLTRRIQAVKREKDKLLAQLMLEESTKSMQEEKLTTIKRNCADLARHLKHEEHLIATRMRTRLKTLQAERQQLEQLLQEQSASVSELLKWAENVRALDLGAKDGDSFASSLLSESPVMVATPRPAAAGGELTEGFGGWSKGNSMVRSPSCAGSGPTATWSPASVRLQKVALQKHDQRLAAAPGEDDVLLCNSATTPTVAQHAVPHDGAEAGGGGGGGAVVGTSLLLPNESESSLTSSVLMEAVSNPRAMVQYLTNEIHTVSLMRQEAVERAEQYRRKREELEKCVAMAERDRIVSRRSLDSIQHELSQTTTTVNELSAANEVAKELQMEREINRHRRSRAQSTMSTSSSFRGAPAFQAVGHANQGATTSFSRCSSVSAAAPLRPPEPMSMPLGSVARSASRTDRVVVEEPDSLQPLPPTSTSPTPSMGQVTRPPGLKAVVGAAPFPAGLSSPSASQSYGTGGNS